MYRILLCHRWNDGSPKREHRAHWREERARLVHRLHPRLGYSRYVQTYPTARWNPLYLAIRASRGPLVTGLFRLMRGVRASPSPAADDTAQAGRWDVVEELAYPSREALLEALSSEAGGEALDELARDHAPRVRRTGVMIAEAIRAEPKREPRFPRVGTLFFLRRRGDMTREQMLACWGTSHKALVESLSGRLGYDAYNQMHNRADAELAGAAGRLASVSHDPFDGVAELAYRSLGGIVLRFINPLTQIANARLIRDEVTFLDHRGSVLVFGRQHRFDPSDTRPESHEAHSEHA